MIQSRAELKNYIQSDFKSMGIKLSFKTRFLSQIVPYIIHLRKTEYYHNCKGFFHNFLKKYHSFRYNKIGVNLGFDIPINVFDKGLNIHHYGCIAVNANAKIGKNCSIQQGVVIGSNGTGGCASFRK